MSKSKILIQLDPDKHASSFDAVVAIDAGVDQLCQYSHVEPNDVRDLVYGTIFTRGPFDLKHTAIFVGGSNVDAGERILAEVTKSFFGPMRVSVLMDSNGANTTASAAVVAASRHMELANAKAAVFAATGPVGQRVVRLLAEESAQVHVMSRSVERAQQVCNMVSTSCPDAHLVPAAPSTTDDVAHIVNDCSVVISAGAAGVQLLAKGIWKSSELLRVAIDLNAVPPYGIEGIEATDTAADHDGTICYGAIGVGGTKMRIHKAAIHRLFESNELVLDATEVFRIGQELEQESGS